MVGRSARWARVGAVLISGMAVGCSSSGAAGSASAGARVRADQARQVAQQAGLGPDVQDFLARAGAASAATYTVVYDQGAGQTTTVVARAPDRRVDIQGAAGADSLDRIVVKGPATFSCHRGGGRWTCQKGSSPAAPNGPFTPDAVAQTIAGLVQLSGAYTFAVTPRRVAGVEASCLSVDRKPAEKADPAIADHGAMCIAANGVILRLEGAGRPLDATSYRPSVPSGAFDLPARVS